MNLSKNINFKIFTPKQYRKKKSVYIKKKFEADFKRIKENILLKQSVFHSFSKKFKLNLSFNKLNKFKKFKKIVIIGMGGSILGAESIYCFLEKKIRKEVIFLDNLNPSLIEKFKKKNLTKTLFILVSKSGNTIETLSIIENFKKNIINKKNTIIITENKKSQLSLFAKKNNIIIIFHRDYIGGRYSIFSETGLVPSYLMGVKINSLKKNILRYIFQDKKKLKTNITNLNNIYLSKKINSLILLNYCNELDKFIVWCQQLIAERLGKKGKGIMPVTSQAPKDHHSLLQLYLDGPKDKFFYIFSIKSKKTLNKKNHFFSKYLNNSNINKIKNDQKNALVELFRKKNIPFIEIEIKKLNEETLGELFSYLILETILIGNSLNINPFDQPAVEEVKVITKKNLFNKNAK